MNKARKRLGLSMLGLMILMLVILLLEPFLCLPQNISSLVPVAFPIIMVSTIFILVLSEWWGRKNNNQKLDSKMIDVKRRG